MAREFWEVFLPRDISIHGVKWNGLVGTAFVEFCYPGSTRMFIARMYKSPGPKASWYLDEIVEKQ